MTATIFIQKAILFLAPLLILFGSGIASSVEAATTVSGNITTDMVWDAVSGPYLVGSVTIDSGATLTIEPGTVIKLNADTLVVDGSLIANGTEAEPIYFTSIKDDKVGGDTNGNGTSTTPSAQDWRGIIFNASSTARFDHVVIRYAGYHRSGIKTIPAIYNRGGNVSVTNSTISDNYAFGIGQKSGSVTVSNSVLTDHKYGAVVSGGNSVFNGNEFVNNQSRGLLLEGDGDMHVSHNTFTGHIFPIDVDISHERQFTHSNNTATDNLYEGIVIRGNVSGSVSLEPDSIPYLITSSGGLDFIGVFSIRPTGNLEVTDTGTLRLNPGAIVKFVSESSLMVVNGTFSALGTADDPVYFTSSKDDTVGGDTNNDGDDTAPEAGDWRDIQFNANATGTFDHAVVRYAGGAQRFGSSQAGLYNSGAVITITNSEIARNERYGVLHNAGTTTIHKSNIHDNPVYGVYNQTTDVLDATNNYWGDPTGPHHDLHNPDGLGDSVSDYVDFEPWRTDGIASDPIDALLLQYAPILQFHEDEDYYPMNVEAFIEASALWDKSGVDEKEFDAEGLTVRNFELFVDSGQSTEDHYLAFSDPDNKKSIDLDAAKTKYNDLVDHGDATTTVYVHKMEDGYEDAFGNEHNFIVLQYWFFYAMNNWLEHGGRNNHEGDWESVFVFLDAETKEPEYVAYSQHLNDGDSRNSVFQYDSVRRKWDSSDVQKEGDSTVSFVALGSHANYPNNEPNGLHDVFGKDDKTSFNGVELANEEDLRNLSDKFWLNYEGKFGADTLDLGGDSGPQGPNFIDTGGTKRFHKPIEWAGIDNVANTLLEPTTEKIDIAKQNFQIQFDEAVDAGTEFSSALHRELINFGENVSWINFVPKFWDFDLGLADGTFNAIVTLSYTDEELEAGNVNEEFITAQYYNEETNRWEEVVLTDSGDNTITFETNHFSRYTIGSPALQSVEEGITSTTTLGRYNQTNDTRDAVLTLTSSTTLPAELRIVLRELSQPDAELVDKDGVTTSGAPYIDVSGIDGMEEEVSLTFALPTHVPADDNASSKANKLNAIDKKISFDVELYSF